MDPNIQIYTCSNDATVLFYSHLNFIVFKESSADIVIRWEYDFLIADMIEWICENKDINNLDNVCIRGKNYESEMIPKHPNYDLNSDTLPAYDLIDFDKYYGDVYKNTVG